jgi:phosphoribosylamine--glycine ligase
MKVLVVGGGAREHTLVWKILQSRQVDEVYAAPGNAGTGEIATNLDVSATDIQGLCAAAQQMAIDLVVVGPEAPLAAGLVDELVDLGIPVFGPTKQAALIESSKVFAKRLMHKYGIPCAEDAVFSSFELAKEYARLHRVPLVVKADGLAAGKGAIIAETTDMAIEVLHDIMEARVFGDAGSQVLIEECLVGQEASLLGFSDGTTVVPIVPARDYKRAYDNDQGPNTGGMGVYSPPGFLDREMAAELCKTVLEPVVAAMAQEGRPYRGVLYAGLMLTAEGPKVLEFNARFGDPETQVQLPLLESDLVDIMMACVGGALDKVKVEWSDDACVGVVMASGGYPARYQVGFPISGLDEIAPELVVFHAGTRSADGRVVTDGGRVLTLVSTGSTVAEAREKVYRDLPRVQFEGSHYRKDIAAEEG